MQLDVSEIKKIGRQVLEALKFLKDKGLPYGMCVPYSLDK